ncbi:unnamed protein product [Gongylonema pulchrum]|uniref:Methyltransf_25 domain-containing protein n=1 Tax=Gongylonema pulchrum TaxID=637853 RepID=A0A183E2B1_9BILA|nr:unnamed protein product [Gongylonema pulchrum]
MRKNWDKFYLRNKNNFFKDRWWTEHEFAKLLRQHVTLEDSLNYLEIGCGVGNAIFPLKQQYPHWNCYAFDFSQNAIRLLHERSLASNLPVSAAHADLTDANFTLHFPLAHVATLIFVLSAIPPEKQQIAVKNVLSVVETGGIVIVRDYGINDHAMVRFGRGCKLDERFYARQDGTMAYYFKLGKNIDF